MQNKGGKMINPNHPQQNPEPSSVAAPAKSRTSPEEPKDDEFRQLSTSSSRNESNDGSELGLERSTHQPQPQPQPKVMEQSIGSPAWEGSRNHDSSLVTPSRSRLRPVRADKRPDKRAAVPKFGAWDENDPQSAENFTYVFNKVREERILEGPNEASFIPNINSYGRRSEPSKSPKKKGCFPWW